MLQSPGSAAGPAPVASSESQTVRSY
jgi:hypothetical protein